MIPSGNTTDTVVERVEDRAVFNLRVAPQFVLDGTTIGVNLGFYFTGETKTTISGTADNVDGKLGKDSEAQYGFGAFVKRGFGKATPQAAVLVTPLLWTANGASDTLAKNGGNTAPIPTGDRFYIAVPVSLGISF